MDIVVKICAVYALFLAFLAIIVTPFTIGAERSGKVNAEHYIFYMSQGVCLIVLAGRTWGWW